MTSHVYLRGLNAETWHSFLRVDDIIIITNLSIKSLGATDPTSGKSTSTYIVLMPPAENVANDDVDDFDDGNDGNGGRKKKNVEKHEKRKKKRRKMEKNSTLTTFIYRIPKDSTINSKKDVYTESSSSSSSTSASTTTLPSTLTSPSASFSSLVSYEGIITRRVDDFTFELDNEIKTRLYLSNYICSDLGVGLRAGSKIILRNVHIIRNTQNNGIQQNSRSYKSREPASTMLGFGACVHTQIQILNIAPGFNTVVVSRHLSKMKCFIKECNTFRTSAWLTATMCTISETLNQTINNKNLFGSTTRNGVNKNNSSNNSNNK